MTPSKNPAPEQVVLKADIVIEHVGWGDPTTLVTKCFDIVITSDIAGIKPGIVTVLLTDDAHLAQLNHLYRDKKGPTNILTFPADPSFASPPAAAAGSDTGPTDLPFWGDLALSYDTCCREAASTGIPLQNHLAHLVIHGLLHLFGYDHLCSDTASRMEALETRLLAGLGISDPYENQDNCDKSIS